MGYFVQLFKMTWDNVIHLVKMTWNFCFLHLVNSAIEDFVRNDTLCLPRLPFTHVAKNDVDDFVSGPWLYL